MLPFLFPTHTHFSLITVDLVYCIIKNKDYPRIYIVKSNWCSCFFSFLKFFYWIKLWLLGSFLLVQQIRDLALSLKQLGWLLLCVFSPWPGNFCMLRGAAKKKKKNCDFCPTVSIKILIKIEQEFPWWCSSSKTDQYPCGRGLNPWLCLVG